MSLLMSPTTLDPRLFINCARCNHSALMHFARLKDNENEHIIPIGRCVYGACKCPKFAKDNLDYVEQEVEIRKGKS